MNRLRATLVATLALGLSAALAWLPSTSSAATTQTAVMSMHPQIAHAGSKAAPAYRARSAMTAEFTPVRSGRKVVLQRWTGSRWVDVTSRAQNSGGRADFTAPYRVNGKVARYRAYAERYNSLGRVYTPSAVTSKWGSADFDSQFSVAYPAGQLPSRWSHRLQDYGTVPSRTCAASTATATRIAYDTARLAVKQGKAGLCQNPSDGKYYEYRINGNIGTQGNYAFTYGYAAARVKFQYRAGQHAAFWLLPQSRTASYGAHGNGAEIDVIEWFGNRTNPDSELSNFVHVKQQDGSIAKRGGYIKRPGRFGSGWANTYHVFSVEWTPSAYVFRIDGKETRRITAGVSARPSYLILSLLSSNFELKFGGADAVTQVMSVDWVRVWDRRR